MTPFIIIKFLLLSLVTIFVLVQSLSWFQLFLIPWTAAREASLSITSSRSLLKLMPIESVMPSCNVAAHGLRQPAFTRALGASGSRSPLRTARPVHALLSTGDIRPLLSQPGQQQDPEVLVWGPGWGPGDGDRLHVVALWERKQSGYGRGGHVAVL